MKKRTINRLWEYYRIKVLAPEAPPIQVHECQQAFYAGVASIVGEMVKMGDSSMAEDEGAQRFQEFIDELGNFVKAKNYDTRTTH